MVGTGETLNLSDPLPAEFTYVSHTSVCGGDSYNAGTRTLTYSGQPASGAVCLITLETTANTAQLLSVTNTATLTKGASSPLALSATVGLNYKLVYLPIVRR
jgi:hypothetical protein